MITSIPFKSIQDADFSDGHNLYTATSEGAMTNYARQFFPDSSKGVIVADIIAGNIPPLSDAGPVILNLRCPDEPRIGVFPPTLLVGNSIVGASHTDLARGNRIP